MALLKSFGSFITTKIINWLPRLITHRLWPVESVAGQVRIALLYQNPINITLGASVPRINVHFVITNHSHIDLILDRLLVKIWISQPLVDGSFLKPISIPKHETIDRLFFEEKLSGNQVESIKKELDNKKILRNVTINYEAYFESKVGDIEIKRQIELHDVLVGR